MYNQKNGEEFWNEVKPFIMVVAAFIIWAISFVLFVVGLRFNQGLMIFGRDVTIPVSAGIALVITFIEMSLVDSVLDDEKDWLLIGIGLASYALGITVGYLALMSLLSLSDPMLQKVVSGALSFLFEVAPERLLIMGLRKMNVNIDFNSIISKFRRGPSRPNQPRRPQNQPKPAQPQNQNRRTVDMNRYQVPAALQSQKTPKVPRPGHMVGRGTSTADGFPELTDADIAAMIAAEEE